MKTFIKTYYFCCWYLNYQLHRDGAPARVWLNNSSEWYINGQLHRDDGPALHYAWGWRVWYWHGKRIDNRFDNKKDWMSETAPNDLDNEYVERISYPW